MKNIISKYRWEKYWSGGRSLVSAFYFGRYYTSLMQKYAGKNIPRAILVSKNGVASCYFSKEDRQVFGEFLCTKVLADTNFVRSLCNTLERQVDTLVDAVKLWRRGEAGAKIFQQYLDLLHQYICNHISPRHIIDYLPNAEIKKHFDSLKAVRLYTEKTYDETEEFVHLVAERLGKKQGIPTHLVLCLLGDEFEKCISDIITVSPNELMKRFRHSVLIFENEHYQLYTGKEAEEIEKSLHDFGDKKYLKGSGAYPGMVVGPVKIIDDPAAANDFMEGDILVAGMTRPEYLPLMRKAGAIVTDSGGILCHAAIVAREIKKPTLIGTEYATKFFNDGDVVEVDATLGTVKKLID